MKEYNQQKEHTKTAEKYCRKDCIAEVKETISWYTTEWWKVILNGKEVSISGYNQNKRYYKDDNYIENRIMIDSFDIRWMLGIIIIPSDLKKET